MQAAIEATNPFKCSPFGCNPIEFWAKANMAAVAATMELFTASTTAANSLLSHATAEQAGAPLRRDVSPTSYEARVAEIRGTSASSARSSTSSSTGKSWYRAPYRSPFDPMFWMTPGHPADHVSDWIKPAMAAGAAVANPFASPFAAPYPTPFGSPLPDWQSAAWMSPMAVWANMMPNSSPASSAATRAATNVVDFETAYAAYRTAGGHASAQISRDQSRSPPAAPRATQPDDAGAAIWGFPFALFGWPLRRS